MVAILKHMREAEAHRTGKRALTLTVPLQEVELRVPESLRQMIESRIERLSDGERRALEQQALPVFCSHCNQRYGSEHGCGDFEYLCEECCADQLVRSAEPQEFPDGTASGRYEFAHALYREAFYRLLALDARRSYTTASASDWRTLFTRSREVAPELAHHFERARLGPRDQVPAAGGGNRWRDTRRGSDGRPADAVELSRKLPTRSALVLDRDSDKAGRHIPRLFRHARRRNLRSTG